MTRIAPATEPWPYVDMDRDYHEGREIWRETSESVYHDQHGVLPPAGTHRGAFLVGEIYDHKGRMPQYAAFAWIGDRYFGRIVPLDKFVELVDGLHEHLGNEFRAAYHAAHCTL